MVGLFMPEMSSPPLPQQPAITDLHLQPVDAPMGTQVFGRGLIEIVDDIVGDNDGLCENGERCLLAPNVGAWQGEVDETYKSYPSAPLDIDNNNLTPDAFVTSFTAPGQ